MSGNTRQRVDYNSLSQEEAQGLLARFESSARRNSIGCRLFGGSKNNDRYGQIQQRGRGPTGKKRNLLAHIVALRAKGTWIPLDRDHQASHLCDNRECYAEDHVVVETHLVNNSRKGCPGDIKCECCGSLCFKCPHKPKCIRE